MFRTSRASDVGSTPIARSINHDDSIVLTPLNPVKKPIKQGFWGGDGPRNKLVPTSQPEVGRRWPPVLAFGRYEIIVDSMDGYRDLLVSQRDQRVYAGRPPCR
jgi:hypothetical protein